MSDTILSMLLAALSGLFAIWALGRLISSRTPPVKEVEPMNAYDKEVANSLKSRLHAAGLIDLLSEDDLSLTAPKTNKEFGVLARALEQLWEEVDVSRTSTTFRDGLIELVNNVRHGLALRAEAVRGKDRIRADIALLLEETS